MSFRPPRPVSRSVRPCDTTSPLALSPPTSKFPSHINRLLTDRQVKESVFDQRHLASQKLNTTLLRKNDVSAVVQSCEFAKHTSTCYEMIISSLIN